jgi:hypothetical protein
MRTYDLTGETFGRWTVLRSAGRKKREIAWLCRCACGAEKAVASSVLRSGRSKSCGCWRIEHGRAHGAVVNLRHGEAGTGRESPEYRVWVGMNARCYIASHTSFRYYGARGIVVCERWRISFENFLIDLGRKPSAKHTLDRIDPNGNYEPNNTRWATYKEQNRNRRDSVRITISGVTKTIAEWLKTAPITRRGFYERLWRGLTPEEALTTPRQPRGRKARAI